MIRFIVGILATLGFMTAGCQKCVRGHDETYTVPGYYYTTYTHIRMGRNMVSIPHQNWSPPYSSVRYICDEYQAKQ